MVVRKEMSIGGESESPGGYQQTEDWDGKNVRVEVAKGESPSRGRHIRKRWVGCSGVSMRPRDTAGAPTFRSPLSSQVDCVSPSFLLLLSPASHPLAGRAAERAGEPRAGGEEAAGRCCSHPLAWRRAA